MNTNLICNEKSLGLTQPHTCLLPESPFDPMMCLWAWGAHHQSTRGACVSCDTRISPAPPQPHSAQIDRDDQKPYSSRWAVLSWSHSDDESFLVQHCSACSALPFVCGAPLLPAFNGALHKELCGTLSMKGVIYSTFLRWLTRCAHGWIGLHFTGAGAKMMQKTGTEDEHLQACTTV